MGIGMATNLQKHLAKIGGPPLLYYNRTASKGEPLKQLGATESTVEDIGAKSDIIFTILSNDSALKSVFKQLLAVDNIKNSLIVDCTTIAPETVDELAELARAKEVRFLPSPVFGVSLVAAAGKLLFTPAGDKKDVEEITPYVQDVMGRRILHVGENPRQSAIMKISGNSFILAMAEAAAEATVVAETSGLSTDIMAEWGQEMGPTIGVYFSKNNSGLYYPPPGTDAMFTADNALKDINHALKLAKDGNTKLNGLEVLKRNLMKAKELKPEVQNMDVSSTYGVVRHEAGLGFENDAVKKRDAK